MNSERILATLLAETHDADDASLAAKAFDHVKASGEDFVHEGRPVRKTEKNVRALADYVREFRAHRLPRWRLLKVID